MRVVTVSTRNWLLAGTVVWDQDGERWVIESVGVDRVVVQHGDRGRHELLQRDLVTWVEDGEWKLVE